MATLAFEDLTFRYNGSPSPALDHVTLTVPGGSVALVCGQSGCGKTTLLRHLKTALRPQGERSGSVTVDGRPLEAMDRLQQAARIGFVMQDPDAQIVTDKVWHELAFGLENLGCPTGEMRARVAEMAGYFGIEDWFRKDVCELSGGQKQMLNLAAVMVMQPDVLVLDEPTSQLDPLAAADLLETVQRLNRDLGLTVVVSEQRLERVFSMVDEVALMEEGRVVDAGDPRVVAWRLLEKDAPMAAALPTAARLRHGVDKALDAAGIAAAARPAGAAPAPAAAAADGGRPVPLTVREGRSWLVRELAGREPTAREPAAGPEFGAAGRPAEIPTADVAETPAAIELKDVWFRYGRELPDVLRGVDLVVPQGCVSALLGDNGAGKSTLLKASCGLLRPYRGRVSVLGKPLSQWKGASLFQGGASLLPQDPLSLFVKDTVGSELAQTLADAAPAAPAARPVRFGRDGEPPTDADRRVREVAASVGIGHLLGSHPADLSTGERQRAAIAKMLLTDPRILLLDEPTKGLDAVAKMSLARILRQLVDEGRTVVLVSHDVEFCASHADRAFLLFDGAIASEAASRQFFSANAFYTTAASCIARGVFPGAVTCQDVVELTVESLR